MRPVVCLQLSAIILQTFLWGTLLAQATLQIIKLLLAQGCRAGKERWQSLCPGSKRGNTLVAVSSINLLLAFRFVQI